MRGRCFSWFFLTTAMTLSAQSSLPTPVLPDGPALGVELFQGYELLLPDPSPFLLGLEVEIAIPRDLIAKRVALAAVVYRSPVRSKIVDLSTLQRLGSAVIPPVGRFFLQIPLQPGGGLRPGPDTQVLEPIKPGAPVLITIMPLDKGLPERPADPQPFQIRSRPVLKNLGALEFKFLGVPGDQKPDLRITADTTLLNPWGTNLLVPGFYEIQISGGIYRPQKLRVAVAKGKTEVLEVTLTESKALVFLELPQGARVFLAGEALEGYQPGTPLVLEKGDYPLQVQVGDYLISRTLELRNPGKYTISLFMELQIKEEL